MSNKKFVQGAIKIESGGCLHCAFIELVSAMLSAKRQPQDIMRGLLLALVDMHAGITDKEIRDETNRRLMASFQEMVDKAVAEIDAEKANDNMGSPHRPGHA